MAFILRSSTIVVSLPPNRIHEYKSLENSILISLPVTILISPTAAKTVIFEGKKPYKNIFISLRYETKVNA